MAAKPSITGICRLCNKKGLIRLSHILPKFMLRVAGLLKEPFSIESHTHPWTSEYHKQDGIKEYLLCDDCEGLFSVWEDYARRALFTSLSTSRRMVDTRLVEWSGIDYPKMKLFTISLLWRMGVSSHGFYSAVTLGEQHESTMRDMLLNKNPGEPWRYGWILKYLVHADKPVGKIFSQPHCGRTSEGRRRYMGVIAGYYFEVDVTSRRPNLQNDPDCLQANGKWMIPIVEAAASSLVRYEFEKHGIYLQYRPEFGGDPP